MSILITEYDYAADLAIQREEAYEDGLFAGLERCLATGREEGISIGLERGLEQGISQDAYQKALETARKPLAMGLSPEQISQATKLPPETISHLGTVET